MLFESKKDKYKKIILSLIELLKDEHNLNEYQNMSNIINNANHNALNPNILEHAGMWYAIIDFYKRDASESKVYIKKLKTDADNEKNLEQKKKLLASIDDAVIRIDVDNMLVKEMEEVIPLYDKLHQLFISLERLRCKLSSNDLEELHPLECELESILKENVEAEDTKKVFL